MAITGPGGADARSYDTSYRVSTSSTTDSGAQSGSYSGKQVTNFQVDKGTTVIGPLALRSYDPELTAFLSGEL